MIVKIMYETYLLPNKHTLSFMCGVITLTKLFRLLEIGGPSHVVVAHRRHAFATCDYHVLWSLAVICCQEIRGGV